MPSLPTPPIYVVVVDEAAGLVGLHRLGPRDAYQSATGSHGAIALETLDEAEARRVYQRHLEMGYNRDGGIG